MKRAPPSRITVDFMVSYFRYLFKERNFSPNTIKSYKAALRDPIRLAFGVDLQDELFHKVMRYCSLHRPTPPPGRLSWSLEKVLAFLASIDPRQCPLKDLLDKTVFLISLASGGRISEISALRRGPEFTYVTPPGILVLRPGPDFLAKNEDPLLRRRPWRISPIPGDDDSLCPVTAMQVYLDRTAGFTSGSLFRHHSSGKPLSVSGLRCCLTSLIKKHNPDSVPKAHDLRKMASSLAFFEGMSFPDITSMTGWSSLNVFVRHYLHEIETLQRTCVVLGRAFKATGKSSA